MFGHLLPRTTGTTLLEVRRKSEQDLEHVLDLLPLRARYALLHGLLRPDGILVGDFLAPGHRACPLASAVWESSGTEVGSTAEVRSGINRLVGGPVASSFYAAFDDWARTHYAVVDDDGLFVLSSAGRAALIRMVEKSIGAEARAASLVRA
jgi:hypothetical protein